MRTCLTRWQVNSSKRTDGIEYIGLSGLGNLPKTPSRASPFAINGRPFRAERIWVIDKLSPRGYEIPVSPGIANKEFNLLPTPQIC